MILACRYQPASVRTESNRINIELADRVVPQQFCFRCIPDRDAAVLACRRQQSAIGTEGDRINPSEVWDKVFGNLSCRLASIRTKINAAISTTIAAIPAAKRKRFLLCFRSFFSGSGIASRAWIKRVTPGRITRFAEMRFQAVVKTPGIRDAVLTAIADENPGHVQDLRSANRVASVRADLYLRSRPFMARSPSVPKG